MRRALTISVIGAAVLVPTVAAAALVVPAQEDQAAADIPAALTITGVGRGHSQGTFSELDYLEHMVVHHAEAVDAARELARSDRPQMRAFGREVVTTQNRQIRMMRGWLATWYSGKHGATPYRPMMRELSTLSDDRLDRAFLQDMIGHHMVAVMMSQRLLVDADSHHEVLDLARIMRDEQHAEILWMRARLTRWFEATGAPAPHGPGSMSMTPHHHVVVR